MRDLSEILGDGPQAGSLLVAHPGMGDPNFNKTVVFLTAYSGDGGAVGVVVNRPMEQTLGEFDPEMTASSLADLPLYCGGPVAADKLILAAWKWLPEEGSFRFFFGIDGAKAEALREQDPDFRICGFMGHAGWTEGQLEAEIAEGAWVLSRWLEGLEPKQGEESWREILLHENPAMRLLADVPDDPSRN